MRRMTIAALCLPALLAGCATTPRLDLCKHAEIRRHVYSTAIAAADVALASGRPLPPEVTLGREAAVTALAVLNAHCPAPD